MNNRAMTESASKPYHLLLASIVCGLAGLFYVYDYFIQVAPSIMTEQLMWDFHIGAGQLGILGGCFYYAYTLMQIPAGLLLDRFGPRNLLIFSVLISGIGVLLFAHAHWLLIAGFSRFLVGLGSAFAFITALYLVASWFPHRYFGAIAGIIQLCGCLGSIIGEAPLALAINHYGWRQSMLVTGLITLVLSFIFYLVIHEGRYKVTRQKNIDSGLRHEWQRLKIIFTNKQLMGIAALGFLSWIPVTAVGALWGVPYLMKIYGINNVNAGHALSLFWLGLGLGSPLIGYVSDRYQTRKQPLLFCFAIGLMAATLLLFAPKLPLSMSKLALFLLGLSAAVQSLSFALVKDIVPATLFGSTSGVNNMAAILGGAFAQPFMGLVLMLTWQGQMQQGIPSYSVANYQTAMSILPLVALLGLLLTGFFIKETIKAHD